MIDEDTGVAALGTGASQVTVVGVTVAISCCNAIPAFSPAVLREEISSRMEQVVLGLRVNPANCSPEEHEGAGQGGGAGHADDVLGVLSITRSAHYSIYYRL